MKTISKILGSKKADGLPWWLILLIIAMIALAVMSFVSRGIINRFLSSVGIIHDETDRKIACDPLFDQDMNTDGLADNTAYDRDGDGINDKCCDSEKQGLNPESEPGACRA